MRCTGGVCTPTTANAVLNTTDLANMLATSDVNVVTSNGAVTIALKDGRILEEVEEYNRGSGENPMTYEELRAKFDDNSSVFLSAAQRDRLADAIRALDELPDASALLDVT